MWYDRSSARMMIFLGAALAFIGIGIYRLEYMWPGLILMMIGIVVLAFGFIILKFHLKMELMKK